MLACFTVVLVGETAPPVCRQQPFVHHVTVMMVPSAVATIALLLTIASATNVQQCPNQTIEGLSNNVQLSPCSQPPCKLKKGTDQMITINFTPEEDLTDVKNSVSANVLGVQLPFVGVDGNSICNKLYNEAGEKTPCPLKAGTKYMYKDSFPILSFYPSLKLKVHWALVTGKDNRNIMCFEVPARIV